MEKNKQVPKVKSGKEKERLTRGGEGDHQIIFLILSAPCAGNFTLRSQSSFLYICRWSLRTNRLRNSKQYCILLKSFLTGYGNALNSLLYLVIVKIYKTSGWMRNADE
jgi:hypothetical protein